MKEESDSLFLHKFCGRRNLPYSLEEKKIAVELLHMGYSKTKIMRSLRFRSSCSFFCCLGDLQEQSKIWRLSHKEKASQFQRQSTLRRETCKIVQAMTPETRKLYAKLVRGVPDEEIIGK